LPILAITFLQLAQAYIKSSREERLETEILEHISIPVKNIIWEEAGKELWVGNRMFDVASITVVDGICQLTGVYDDDETEVAGSLLHSIISKKGSDLLHLLLLLQAFIGGLFVVHLVERYRHRDKQLIFYTLHLPYPFYVVLSPPPR
jgi:hypothetical protein